MVQKRTKLILSHLESDQCEFRNLEQLRRKLTNIIRKLQPKIENTKGNNGNKKEENKGKAMGFIIEFLNI